MERERERERVKEKRERGLERNGKSGGGKKQDRYIERDCSDSSSPTHLSIVLYSNDIVLCEAGKGPQFTLQSVGHHASQGETQQTNNSQNRQVKS